jgi:hypothetical protein
MGGCSSFFIGLPLVFDREVWTALPGGDSAAAGKDALPMFRIYARLNFPPSPPPARTMLARRRATHERMTMAMDLKAVEELIREIELADSIDWGMLSINEADATRLIALSVVQHYEDHIRPMSESDREYVFVSAIAKLTLENFVLNVKLAQARAK